MFCFSGKFANYPVVNWKKHIDEIHGGTPDSVLMEFDHILPLYGPGHVEKNVLTATITMLWDLIRFEKMAATCNFKSNFSMCKKKITFIR